jgi:DivIVA domain-containing protein
MREASSNDDLENTTFSTALRGYDRDEVDAFVRTIAEEMRVLNEGRNEKLYESLGEEMGALLQHARDSADTMKREAQEDAAAARAAADEEAAATRAAADEDAQRIREEAARRAKELQQNAEQQAAQTRTEAEKESSTRVEQATEKVRRLEATEGQARARLQSMREELASIANDLRLIDDVPEDDDAEDPQNVDGQSGTREQEAEETLEQESEDRETVALEPQRSSIR